MPMRSGAPIILAGRDFAIRHNVRGAGRGCLSNWRGSRTGAGKVLGWSAPA